MRIEKIVFVVTVLACLFGDRGDASFPTFFNKTNKEQESIHYNSPINSPVNNSTKENWYELQISGNVNNLTIVHEESTSPFFFNNDENQKSSQSSLESNCPEHTFTEKDIEFKRLKNKHKKNKTFDNNLMVLSLDPLILQTLDKIGNHSDTDSLSANSDNSSAYYSCTNSPVSKEVKQNNK